MPQKTHPALLMNAVEFKKEKKQYGSTCPKSEQDIPVSYVRLYKSDNFPNVLLLKDEWIGTRKNGGLVMCDVERFRNRLQKSLSKTNWFFEDSSSLLSTFCFKSLFMSFKLYWTQNSLVHWQKRV